MPDVAQKNTKLNPKDLKAELYAQMEENKKEGRIRQDMGFGEYLLKCWETLDGRKDEIKVLRGAGNLDQAGYNSMLEEIKMIQDVLKRIDSDNPISVLVGKQIR
jgi:hypothetical protein